MTSTTTPTQYPQAGGKLPSEHDGFAIASLVTAFFVPILAIIFGHLSNHRAKLAHRAKSALAVTGLVLGYVFTGITALIIVIVVAVAGSTTPSVSASAAPPASSAPASPAAPAAPSTPADAPSTPPAAPDNTGPVGTAYTITNGDGTKYAVTLTSVGPAYLTQYETLDHYTDHMVAAHLTITGKAGNSTDDANSVLTVIGSDGQVYQPSFNDTTAGTNFDSGDFRVGPGQSVRGVVNFELPHGVTVKSLQWAPSLDGQTATWTVG
jgi:hypothetical protein